MVTVLDKRFPVVEGAVGLTGMRLWPEGRRAYQLTSSGQVVALDLDTFEEVARSTDDLGKFFLEGTGQPFLVVDEDRGWIVVAEEQFTGGVRSCLGTGCVEALHVLDARTLDLLHTIPINGLGLDGENILRVQLHHLWFDPSGEYGDGGRLYLLLAEGANDVLLNDQAFAPKKYREFFYLAQVDISTRVGGSEPALEWVRRLDGCTSHPPHPGGNSQSTNTGVHNPYLVFRSQVPGRPFLYVGCYGASAVSAVIRFRIAADGPLGAEERFAGPSGTARMYGDPVTERVLIESGVGKESLSWWVFDGALGGFVGQAGIGPYDAWDFPSTLAGTDPETGRLYVVAARKAPGTPPSGGPGGLFTLDARRTRPALPQAIHHVNVAPSINDDYSYFPTGVPREQHIPMVVDPAADGRPARIFAITKGSHASRKGYLVFEDRLPVSQDPTNETAVAPSADVDEAAGATVATYNGQGLGFGFRMLALGGLDPLVRAAGTGQNDWAEFKEEVVLRDGAGGLIPKGYSDECGQRDREFVFGLAGSHDAAGIIDELGKAKAAAHPAFVDAETRRDLERPYDRCQYLDHNQFDVERDNDDAFVDDEEQAEDDVHVDLSWQGLMNQLGVRADEPDELAWRFEGTSCDEENVEGESTDEVVGGIRAEVTCDPGRSVTASSATRVADIGPISVAEAASTFEVLRGDDGGLMATSISVVRGLRIAVPELPAVEIAEIRAVAQSWATGRHQDVPGEGVDVNCDLERTAGTCYRRTFSGVRIAPHGEFPGFSCDECYSDEQVGDALRSAIGSQFVVRLRQADHVLAQGNSDGSQAALQKSEPESFADAVLNEDKLRAVYALELMRVGDGHRRGRYLFQFAGTQVSTTYHITCLLQIVDGQCTEEPASLEIALHDPEGQPLPGGVFTVKPDPNGDGVIDLDESLAEGHACTTAIDGTCGFETIQPGSYVVTETLAPPGYLASDPAAITLFRGSSARVEFVNGQLGLTGIAVSLSDTADPPQPLPGAVFEVRSDVDGDEMLGAQDLLAGSCTTGDDGICRFDPTTIADPLTDLVAVGADAGQAQALLQVPAGPYVLHQASAPDGYQPADDIAFTLPQDRIARIGLRNGRAQAAGNGAVDTGTGGDTGATTDGSDTSGEAGPGPWVPETPTVDFGTPAGASGPIVLIQQQPPTQQPPMIAGPAQGPTYNVFNLPKQAVQLMVREPKDAVSFAALALLLAAAIAGAVRRRAVLSILAN